MAQGDRNPRGIRRGGTLQGLLITLAVIGGITTVAIILGPRYLVAGVQGHRPGLVRAGHEEHQTLIDELGRLISGSVGVIAIHARGATPYEEIVLWLADSDPDGTDGRADERELAVMSHSAILQTVTIYRMAGGGRDVLPTDPPRDSPAFCNRWRSDPRVSPVIVAGGVSDMRIERVGSPQDEWGQAGLWGGLQRLRLSLTWAPDSADGPDEASVLVDTVMFPSGPGD